MDTKENILDTIDDLCSDFVYYDRKEDEELTAQQLKDAVEKRVITIKDMVDRFEACLKDAFIRQLN